MDSNSIKLFIAYSRKDTVILNELLSHLQVFVRTNKITIWYDGMITAGSYWEESINKNIYNSDIILFLITHNFIASDYCYNKEMTEALRLHSEEKLVAIPIIAKECLWQETPLAKLQALPKKGTAINSPIWQTENKPYVEILIGLKDVILQLRNSEITPNIAHQNKTTNINTIDVNLIKSDLSSNVFDRYVDPRDNRKYKIAHMKDGNIWMAENLNFDIVEGCWNSKNGESSGKTYTWESAIKACPPGWRVPSDDDWWEMIKFYGGTANRMGYGREINSLSGTDAYKELTKKGKGNFNAGLNESYWSSSKPSIRYAFNSGFSFLERPNVNRNSNSKYEHLHCRCILNKKDE